MRLAVIVAAALLAAVAVFQIGLALGAPFGDAAWGGQHGRVLPNRLRIFSGVAALLVYPLAAVLVLASAGLITGGWLPGSGERVMWALAGFFTLGALANFSSQSAIERFWGPVSLAIAICCGIIADGI